MSHCRLGRTQPAAPLGEQVRVASGRRKCLGEALVDRSDALLVQWTGFTDPGSELLGPGHIHLADEEVTAYQGPVGGYEAQCGADADVVVSEGLAHKGDWLEGSIDEAGTVSCTDEK